MTPTQVGDIANAEVVAALLKRGETVLLPVGDGLRYDVGVERDRGLIRVQSKSGVLKNGSIVFRTNSTRLVSNGVKRETYKGQADYFGVYCAEADEVYLVPVHECGNQSGALRLKPPRNGQAKGVRWARDYRADVARFG